MKSRSLVASVGGTALRLLIAAAAVAAAYLTGATLTDEPSRTLTLSAQSIPAENGLIALAPGRVSVGELTDCSYRVSSAVESGAVAYEWTLQRFSARSGVWQDYLSTTGGFDGAGRTVDWHVRVPGNPGTYRAILDVSGDRTMSEKFQVTC
ncbi:hypothetical protein [Herbidospora mongoliensis]|uniref:hypothetical protein n=1 Tax=Herbidospora mongoliensis TaxID=688067 RepID=UPI00082B4BF5|nr:hypothetical protein [Herbidospora mongoliensis]